MLELVTRRGWIWAAVAGFGVLWVVLLTWSFATGSAGQVGLAGYLVVYPLFACLIGGPAVAAWRYRTTRVTISPTHVIVRNLLDTTTVAFDEIAGFELDDRARVNMQLAAVLLRLTPGAHGIPRSLRLTALSPGSRGADWNRLEYRAADVAMLTPIVAELNAELDRRRTGEDTTAYRLKAAHPALHAVGWGDKD